MRGLAVIALALLGACSDDRLPLEDAGTPIDGGPIPDAGALPDSGAADTGAVPLPVEAQNYCALIVDFFCEYYLRCGRIVAADTAECRSVFLETCTDRFQPRYVAQAEAGRLRLSESGIARCREHLAVVACEAQIRDLDGECAFMWVGQVEQTGACGFDIASFVCAPGTTCVIGPSLCGQCAAVLPESSTCGGSVSNGVCGPAAQCVNNECIRRPAVGEPCAQEPRCVLGASCVGGSCVAPEIVGVGQSCDQSHRCPYKAACVGGTCVETGLLEQTCSSHAPCASGFCKAGRCAPLVETGLPCTEDGECVGGRCNTVCESADEACF